MRDLKHIHYYEELLEQTANELVLKEKEEGGVAAVGSPIALLAESEDEMEQAKSKAANASSSSSPAPPKAEETKAE